MIIEGNGNNMCLKWKAFVCLNKSYCITPQEEETWDPQEEDETGRRKLLL